MASPAPSDRFGCVVRSVRSLDQSPGKSLPLPIRDWKTLQAAGAGVAVHFALLPTSSRPPPPVNSRGHPFAPSSPGLGVGGQKAVLPVQ